MREAASTHITTRRQTLAGLAAASFAAAAGMAATPLRAASADAPSNIAAAIAAHRAARAEMEAASAARDAIERPLAPFDFEGRPNWNECFATMPGFAEAVERSARALDAEEEAFRALLTAAVQQPDEFIELARYACEITEEHEGLAIEGASAAYRMLAAFAGLDCWTEMPASLGQEG